MGKIEITLPAMGEGIIEATITKWFVSEGDHVDEDDALLEVATDKVDSEVPSPFKGKISQIIYHEGEIPKVGEVLAILESDEISDDETDIGPTDVQEVEISKPTPPKATTVSIPQPREMVKSAEENNWHLTPFVRFLAKERGIPLQELKRIKGSGSDNRITRDDLNSYIRAGRPFKIISGNGNGAASDAEYPVLKADAASEYIPADGEKLVPMDRTRKLIAEHMVRSKRTSPHVTSTVEVDVTHMVQWREANKESFQQKHGVKLTYTPVIVEAAAKALKQFPGINISVVGDHIVQKSHINIGVATALPDGNLIVPVLHDADQRNFVNIATELFAMVKRARTNKLLPSDIKGGTFTITNMGQYDNISGTPIINQPEVAILAVGAIKKKPGVVEINGELTIGVRDILVLSLTYDHRVLDGSLGGSFVKAIATNIEKEQPNY